MKSTSLLLLVVPPNDRSQITTTNLRETEIMRIDAQQLLLAAFTGLLCNLPVRAAFVSKHPSSLEPFDKKTVENRPFSQPRPHLATTRRPPSVLSRRLAASIAATAVDAENVSTESTVEVVSFGVGDLRIADHVGLSKALQASNNNSNSRILPVVLLTDQQLAAIPGATAHTVDTARLLAAAVQDLQARLEQDYGLGLHVALTGAGTVAQALATLVGTAAFATTTIHVSDLGDADNNMGYGAYSALLQHPVNKLSVVAPWSSHLREAPWGAVELLSDQYPVYQAAYRKDKPPRQPLSIPIADYSGRLLQSVDYATTLTANDIENRMRSKLSLDDKQCQAEHNTGMFATHWGGLDPSTVTETAVQQNLLTFVNDCGEQDDVWSRHERYVTRGARRNGRSLEHAGAAWQLRGDGRYFTGHTENWLAGESMTRYLAAPLFFGTVSPATVWHASTRTDYGPFFTSPLRTLVEGHEWHNLLAARNMRTDPAYQGTADESTTYQFWRWHGFLCRYTVTDFNGASSSSESDDDHDEGVLLIHGFGASGSQWNKAMQELAKTSTTATQGLAPDLIGFGHSEKPAISYTSYVWDAYSVDFGKEVAMGRHQWKSFVVGGNSIGGFTSIGMAASDTAAIEGRSLSSSGAPGTGCCTGLVLMNSAGPVSTREEIDEYRLNAKELQLQSVAQVTAMDALPPCKPPGRPIARAFGNVLLTYLRPNIQSICKNLYPTNPDAVDDFLCAGILRDSLDPGAINVMVSGAKLPPPRTANELLRADFGGAVTNEGSMEESTFDGPVLVSTGVLDPLNDARDRTRRFCALRQGISVDEIQAGHCPHDELVSPLFMHCLLKFLNGDHSHLSCGSLYSPLKLPQVFQTG